MIRFKCIYCGQRILAKDDGAGKKGKCPKCSHLLTVPASTKGRPAISIEKTEPMHPPKAYVPEWEKDLYPSFDTFGEKDSTELLREQWGFLVPTYDKLSLLLMAVTLILLFVTNSQMRSWIKRDWTQDMIFFINTESITYRIIFGIVPIFIVALFSPLAVFSKTIDFKKKVMLVFAVLTNAISGVIAGLYVLKSTTTQNWLLVFPIWNIINGFLMVTMLRFGIIDEECISDRKASASEVILGLIAVLVIFIFCNFVFRLHWAITFSICIVYTTSFDRALQSVFPGLYKGSYAVKDEVRP